MSPVYLRFTPEVKVPVLFSQLALANIPGTFIKADASSWTRDWKYKSLERVTTQARELRRRSRFESGRRIKPVQWMEGTDVKQCQALIWCMSHSLSVNALKLLQALEVGVKILQVEIKCLCPESTESLRHTIHYCINTLKHLFSCEMFYNGSHGFAFLDDKKWLSLKHWCVVLKTLPLQNSKVKNRLGVLRGLFIQYYSCFSLPWNISSPFRSILLAGAFCMLSETWA